MHQELCSITLKISLQTYSPASPLRIKELLRRQSFLSPKVQQKNSGVSAGVDASENGAVTLAVLQRGLLPCMVIGVQNMTSGLLPKIFL